MLTLAHESVLPPPRRGWATATSFAVQAVGVTVALLIPLLQPDLLPRLDLTPHIVPIFMPHMETPSVQHGSASSSMATKFAAFVAPWEVPNAIDRSADSKPIADAEPACVGCIPVVGQPTLPTGMTISMLAPAPLPTVVVAKPTGVSRMMDGFLIHRVQPDYPVLARQARIQGPVELAALISRRTIENLQVLSGHPMLTSAALNAVKQWRYRPYVLNGNPIEVDTKITVIFTLGN